MFEKKLLIDLVEALMGCGEEQLGGGVAEGSVVAPGVLAKGLTKALGHELSISRLSEDVL